MKPEKMFWYKFYIQDYQRDTGHLSLIEHGAYRLLIDRCFQSEGILPASLDAIYRLTCAMSKPEQAAIRSVLGQFFVLSPDGYRQKRISKELARLNLAGSSSRKNGASGGRPPGSGKGGKNDPKNNLSGFENVTCPDTNTEPRANPDHNPDPNPNITLVISQELEEKNLPTYKQARAREGALPMSAIWEPSPAFWTLAKRSSHTPDNPGYADALTDFIAYWLTNPGESRTQSQWEKSFLESWKRYRAHSLPADKAGRKRTTGLSPHNDFEKRDYSAGINADGSF